jgi:hypothetical protein
MTPPRIPVLRWGPEPPMIETDIPSG